MSGVRSDLVSCNRGGCGSSGTSVVRDGHFHREGARRFIDMIGGGADLRSGAIAEIDHRSGNASIGIKGRSGASS